MKSLLFLFVPALLVAPALAGEPSGLVQRFYEDIGLESTLTGRALFTTPAAGIFAMDEKLSNGGEEIGCIDFGLAIDAQDYDDAEIARTLELDETVEGDKRRLSRRSTSSRADSRIGKSSGRCAGRRASGRSPTSPR